MSGDFSTRFWRMALGITQQLVKNGGGFVISLALAFFLAPDELGAYSIIIAVHGFFNLMHAAFLAEPMMLFAWRDFRDNQKGYIRRLGQLQWLASAGAMGAVALVAGLASLFGAPPLVTGALWVLVLVQPLGLLVNYLERRLFLHLRSGLALIGASLQLSVVTGLIVLVSEFSTLSVERALGLLGISYLVVSLSHLLCLRFLPVESDTGVTVGVRDVAARHFAYGRWSGLAHGLWWLVQNAYIFATGWFLSLAAAGNFKILITLTNPGTMAMSALGMVLLPMLTSVSAEGERHRILRASFMFVLSVGVVFALAFIAVAPWVLGYLFDGKFSVPFAALLIAAPYPILVGCFIVAATLSRAIGRPELHVWGNAIALVLTMPLGFAVVIYFGVTGTIAAQLFTVAVVFSAIYLFIRSGRARAASH